MDESTRRALLDQYRAGPDEVAAALADAPAGALDVRPAPDEWSAREVAHHLADSETMSTIRLRRLLVEDEPLIAAYDEVAWAKALHYERPIETSMAVLRAVRASNAELLDRLGPEDWARRGTHSDSGPYGVQTWLEIYASHAHDHANQIRAALSTVSRS